MQEDERIRIETCLARAAGRGDAEAWRLLYESAFGSLLAFVRSRLRGRADLVEELVQEVWMVALRRIGDFEASRAPFGAWLRGIARRLLGRATGVSDEALPPESPAVRGADRRDLRARILAVLDRIPDPHQSLLQARYIQDLSVAEIAQARGATVKAIEAALFRARGCFREVFTRIE